MAVLDKSDIVTDATILATFWTRIIDALAGTTATDIRLKITTNAQIAANQNDYVLGAGVIQRMSSDASRNVTGITGGADGMVKIIFNIGTQNIVFKHNDAASLAANRITNITGADITVAGGGRIILIYDGTSSVWRAGT